jgi:hypothetical protein
MTTALYDIETSEAADGTMVPAEGIWTPEGKAATDNGFVVHRGLYVTGIGTHGDDGPSPAAFVLLGHHRWADAIEGAAAYMDRVYGWRSFHTYPGDDPSDLIPRIPRAVLTRGVFLRHPHPDHPCGCEWEDTWRVVWAPAAEPGAIPVTAMRHPAAPPTTVDLPNPDHGVVAATWAP